jgi:RimJ/RimL family protein N-acetyltransferase
MNIELRQFIGEYDWGWCQAQVGTKRCEDTGGIMAIDSTTDTTVGACLFDNWTNNSVQCHFMITTPMVLKHGFLEACFDFMFNVGNVSRVYGLVPGNNTKAIKFNEHMGFTIKATMEEAYDVGIDYLLMEMKRENCRFIADTQRAA